jgi:DNA invertase Pin-like site-specific DNA recombinase
MTGAIPIQCANIVEIARLVMVAMFATLAKQERARISERTIAGLKVARTKGRVLGRPPLLKRLSRRFFY